MGQEYFFPKVVECCIRWDLKLVLLWFNRDQCAEIDQIMIRGSSSRSGGTRQWLLNCEDPYGWERRFGALPTGVRDRVGTADTASLEAWGLRVLDAASLDDVLR
jgi:hypothetical protein